MDGKMHLTGYAENCCDRFERLVCNPEVAGSIPLVTT